MVSSPIPNTIVFMNHHHHHDDDDRRRHNNSNNAERIERHYMQQHRDIITSYLEDIKNICDSIVSKAYCEWDYNTRANAINDLNAIRLQLQQLM